MLLSDLIHFILVVLLIHVVVLALVIFPEGRVLLFDPDTALVPVFTELNLPMLPAVLAHDALRPAKPLGLDLLEAFSGTGLLDFHLLGYLLTAFKHLILLVFPAILNMRVPSK